MKIKPPFPWFGGKARASKEIWRRLGNPSNYVEPFAGSLAVLLNRPHESRTETINDLDCYVANFFRAVGSEPMEVARWADAPVNEADLHAVHLWLCNQSEFRARMHSDIDYYDCRIAGRWVNGICQWIGSGWCAANCYDNDNQWQKLPHLGNAGMGIHRPSQQLPHLGSAGMGIHRGHTEIYDYFAHLSARLRRVRVCCGDWSRVLGDSVTFKHGLTGVLLDPPYSHDERDDDLYAQDHDVAADVRVWAVANGDNPLLRIALCGYSDSEYSEHDMPQGWTKHLWKTSGGYGSQGDGRGRENANRETIWFSPHCLPVNSQASLFDFSQEHRRPRPNMTEGLTSADPFLSPKDS